MRAASASILPRQRKLAACDECNLACTCAALLIVAMGVPFPNYAIGASANGATAPGPTILGAYIGNPGDPASPWEPILRAFTSAMGQSPKIVLQYHGL